jgi:hypothetical protein
VDSGFSVRYANRCIKVALICVQAIVEDYLNRDPNPLDASYFGDFEDLDQDRAGYQEPNYQELDLNGYGAEDRIHKFFSAEGVLRSMSARDADGLRVGLQSLARLVYISPSIAESW